MKLVTIAALVLAATASLSAGAATGQQADKAPATTVQPHSHLQEKTGIMPQKKPAKTTPEKEQETTPATAQEAEAATQGSKRKADKDRTKHFHPRDGK